MQMNIRTICLCCLLLTSCRTHVEKRSTRHEEKTGARRAAPGSTGRQEKKSARENGGHKKRIREALASLLTRTNTDAFVILEDRSSKKFVQFAGGARKPLLLDLPARTLASRHLDREELGRARELFAKYGVSLEEREARDPAGKVVGTMSGFHMSLGRDVDKATEVAREVFSEVYALPPDFRLRVVEN